MYALFVIGRILFGGYFVYNALGHFMKLGPLSGYAASKKIPLPKAAVIISGVALLLGGLSIIVNFSVLIGLWILVAFMVVVTLTMHQFWREHDPMHRMNETIQFSKNVAIIGALLILISFA
jgi:uncharacterized membrane protein YphA (DoxX/SURF4 family)